MIEGLAAQLDAAGAPIDRIGLTSRTLHPQLAGWSVYWSRMHGVRRNSLEHGARGSDAYVGSPIQRVQENLEAVHLHIGSQPQEGEHSLVQDLREEGITDYYALPMISSAGTVNAMTLATSHAAGFSEADFERFKAMSNLLAPLIEIIAVRRSTLGLLNTLSARASASASSTVRSSAATAIASTPRSGIRTCAASPSCPKPCRPTNCCHC